MRIRSHLTAAVGVALSVLAFASPASAFEPPELFVRVATSQPPGPWVPLASAPRLDFMRGWEVGYRVQPSGQPNERQAASLSVIAVPGGAPARPENTRPYCGDVIGTAGEIVPVGAVGYEGNGSYTVSVSIGPAGHNDLRGDCSAATATGGFSTNVVVNPRVHGIPFVVRRTPRSGEPAPGVRAEDPPGGHAEVQCALDATVQPDGSLRGRAVAPDGGPGPEINEWDFPLPGAWTCVARGTIEDDDVHSPWGPPIAVTVKAEYSTRALYVSGRRSRLLRFKYVPDFPNAAVGATGTLEIKRLARCGRSPKPVYRRFAIATAKFDANGIVKIGVRRPKADGFYVAVLSVSGAPFYADAAKAHTTYFHAVRGRYRVLSHPPICTAAGAQDIT